jgi:hypothetical protein
LVALKPILGQGYMLFDKVNNPEVHVWKVSLVKRSFNNLGDFKDEIVEITKLPNGTNYLFIPIKFRKMGYPIHYLVNVEGLNPSGIPIVTENSIHLNNFNNINDDIIQTNGDFPFVETDCRKTCNSNFYAYHIQQFQKLGPGGLINLSRFRVVPAFQSFDPQSQTANPYYWYSTTDLGPFANPIHQIGPFISGPNGNVTVNSPAGNPLIGLVYGYRKTLGAWVGSHDIETDGQHSIGNEFCGTLFWTLTSTINLMNSNAANLQPGNPSNYPPLECIPANTGGSGGGIPIDDPTPPSSFDDFVTFCFNGLTGIEEPCENGTDPIIDILNPEIVDLVIITDLNDNTKPPVYINVSELYNINNGAFTSFNTTLTPGLYSFGFMYKEEGYWSAIKEVQTKMDFGLTQADMVEITVFPSPMVGNKYDVKVKAFASVKFSYELRDFTGNLVLTKNFVVHKGHEKIKKITNNNIPEGTLLHRFIFEDGSVKIIQSIKN